MRQSNRTHSIKLPGARLRKYADALIECCPIHREPPLPKSSAQTPIRVVCLSDTHNTQPELPDGDILIHAGDLTEWGHFDELQAHINWLAAQPHPHKIVIAGNHDTLLHADFVEQHPRHKEDERTLSGLHWPDNLHYLCETSITLSISTFESSVRRLKIFGSPWTPQYGVSAFQYPVSDDKFWHCKIPDNTDIIVTHGPPRLHLDEIGFRHAGCPYLAQEVARVRPKLHVFGHIHVAYGRSDVVLDSKRRRYSEIINFYSHSNWDLSGWRLLIEMGVVVVLQRFMMAVAMAIPWKATKTRSERGSRRVTTMVNAAIVGGPNNEVRNPPVVVEV